MVPPLYTSYVEEEGGGRGGSSSSSSSSSTTRRTFCGRAAGDCSFFKRGVQAAALRAEGARVLEARERRLAAAESVRETTRTTRASSMATPQTMSPATTASHGLAAASSP